MLMWQYLGLPYVDFDFQNRLEVLGSLWMFLAHGVGTCGTAILIVGSFRCPPTLRLEKLHSTEFACTCRLFLMTQMASRLMSSEFVIIRLALANACQHVAACGSSSAPQ